MSIFSRMFRSRDKPQVSDSTVGSSYRFFFGGSSPEEGQDISHENEQEAEERKKTGTGETRLVQKRGGTT